MISKLKDNLILAAEWHSIKNGVIPDDLSSGSGRKVWWKCNKGHEWETRIAHRSAGSKCPSCAGIKAVHGKTDLFTTHPKIASQWHPTKNGVLTSQEVTAGSSKKVWWLDECGHEWETTVLIRSSGGNCPYCSGNKTLAGFNDLGTTHPVLALQWRDERNVNTVSSGSKYKAVWECDKGHNWEAQVKNRTLGRGCPYCSNHKRFEGLNDLLTVYPHIASQWNNTKNTGFDIKTISLTSPEQVWWKCDKGHEWFCSVAHRTRKGLDCPVCYQSSGTSRMEQDLYEYLNKSTGSCKVLSRVRINNYEIDVYIPEKNIGIEFNGLYWHSEDKGKDFKYHYDKWLFCKNNDIQLIQVWEDDWKEKPDLIKRMLLHKLGLNGKDKIFARNTYVKKLTQKETDVFLNINHIQGSVSGGIRLGLVDITGIIVSVMVLKTENGSKGRKLNLLRYATSCAVPGGFTKLLKHVEKEYKPESIITFSDNTVSDGKLYENNGFENTKTIKPDYMYIVNGKRVHKFNYRLKRFREDPSLLFEEELTEKQLAELNNLSRIWDAGKIRWEKQI